MTNKLMPPELEWLLPVRRGHFRFESGHHGNRWLDLELLCLQPEAIRELAAQLAARLAPYKIDAVCGPLVEGAFVALMVAAEMKVEFLYAERFERPELATLFPVEYRLPAVQRARVAGRRVAIVNDVINAGSAVRGTFKDLIACGSKPVAIGTLLTLGLSASEFAAGQGVPLETLAVLSQDLWEPAQCPLCASGVAIDQPTVPGSS